VCPNHAHSEEDGVGRGRQPPAQAPGSAKRAARYRKRPSAGSLESGAGGDDGCCSVVDGVDDLSVVDALEVDRCDPEVGVSELALDHDDRDAFASHLHSVSVPQLVWCEAASDRCFGCGAPQLEADGVLCPRPSLARAR
jgi:hypothetical protein